MSEETAQVASIPESFSDPGEAFRWMSSQPKPEEKAADTNSAAESADSATAATESAVEADTAPLEEAHGDDEVSDPASKEPPIARPKSWTDAEEAEWRSTPRALQQKIAARELERDTATRRGQNEVAEARKATEAKQAEVEQARQNYETQAKAAQEVLLREQIASFKDIKSMQDVLNLSQTDPLRYIQWQAHQQELQMYAEVTKQAEQRAAQEQSSKWQTFRQEQDKLAMEHIPELGDAKRAPDFMKKAVSLLQDVGFTPQDLGKLDSGEKLSLFDHRMQRIIADAARYRDMQTAKTAVLSKPIPTVQRPGVKSADTRSSSALQKATQAFNLNPTEKNAAALAIAKRQTVRH